MAYTPTVWETGDIITAEKLNNIEDGIVANEEAAVGKTIHAAVSMNELMQFVVTPEEELNADLLDEATDLVCDTSALSDFIPNMKYIYLKKIYKAVIHGTDNHQWAFAVTGLISSVDVSTGKSSEKPTIVEIKFNGSSDDTSFTGYASMGILQAAS